MIIINVNYFIISFPIFADTNIVKKSHFFYFEKVSTTTERIIDFKFHNVLSPVYFSFTYGCHKNLCLEISNHVLSHLTIKNLA